MRPHDILAQVAKGAPLQPDEVSRMSVFVSFVAPDEYLNDLKRAEPTEVLQRSASPQMDARSTRTSTSATTRPWSVPPAEGSLAMDWASWSEEYQSGESLSEEGSSEGYQREIHFAAIGRGSFGSVFEIQSIDALADIFEETEWMQRDVFFQAAANPREFLGRILGRPLHPLEFGEGVSTTLEKLLVIKTQFPCAELGEAGSAEHLQELNAICAEALDDGKLSEIMASRSSLVERSGTVDGMSAGATVPTIASEALAGGVINGLPDSRHFMKTLLCGFESFKTSAGGQGQTTGGQLMGGQIAGRPQIGAALMLERVVPLSKSNILSGPNGLFNTFALLFQTVHALQEAQNAVRFLHGDLHLYNLAVRHGSTSGSGVMGDPYRFWTSELPISTVETSQHVELRLPETLCAKIIDFGGASFDIPVGGGGGGAVPSRARVAARHSAGLVYQYGAFHPMFDLAMLLGPYFAVEIQRKTLPLTLADYFALVSNCLGVDTARWTPDENGVRDYIKVYYQVGIPRPRPELFGAMRYGSLSAALTFLARKLADLGLPVRSLHSAPVAAQRPFARSIETAGVTDEAPPFFSAVSYTIVDSDGTPLVSTMPLPVSNASRVHIVAIETQHPSAERWTFATGCCRVDTISVASEIGGVALNGAFFDPFNDYRPILSYQKGAELTQSNGDGVLAAYAPLQGVVVIRGREIGIVRPGQDAVRMAGNSDAAFISSPVLFENGRLVFTSEGTANLDAASPGRHLFECRSASDTGMRRAVPVAGLLRPRVAARGQPTVTYPDCNALVPGELAHASLRASRSMLIISPTHTYFVVVDGPENQDFGAAGGNAGSAGVTLYTLAKLVQARVNNVPLFPGAQNAIALHGGKNSNLTWNFGRGIVSTSHALPFPGGNILVFAPVR